MGVDRKGIGNLKLAGLTGLAALGPRGAGVAHAQAPSGPITSAPAQPAPGTSPNASNPAPALPPRTTILGAWKLNPDDSDDPRKRRNSQDSNGGYGGGRGRMGGGYPGGGHGGYGGGRPGGGREEKGGQKNRPLPPPRPAAIFF